MKIFEIILIVVVAIFIICNLMVYFVVVFPFLTRKKIKIPTEKSELCALYKPYADTILGAMKFLSDYGSERVTVKSFDKHKLSADLFTVENAKGTVILFHGFQAYAYTDMGVAARHFIESGYNALVVYQRAHLESEGRFICFGVKERYDCLSWINLINERFGCDFPLYLYGISMGGATILMATGFDLPKNVKCVIADCAYTSAYEVFCSLSKYSFPFLQIAQLQVFLFAGYSLKQYSTIDALKTNKIPVIFFHGKKDAFVPYKMSQKNYDACIAKKEIYFVDSAKHTQSLYVNPEFYWQKIDNFMNKA